jgi:hypothetical protein
MVLDQSNPTLDKFGLPLDFAGDGVQGAILSGLGARLRLVSTQDEILLIYRIYTDDGFENNLTGLGPLTGSPILTDIVHGVDSKSSSSGTRNFIEWVTNRGRQVRQFWVKDLPTSGYLYIDNQDASVEAVTFVNVGDSQEKGNVITFSINILPNFEDEFFTQQEFVLNRYAQTRRAWGGATTAEVFLNDILIIPEQAIENIHGYYWENPQFGSVPIKVRLRAKTASSDFVDLHGTIRARQIPCPT